MGGMEGVTFNKVDGKCIITNLFHVRILMFSRYGTGIGTDNDDFSEAASRKYTISDIYNIQPLNLNINSSKSRNPTDKEY